MQLKDKIKNLALKNYILLIDWKAVEPSRLYQVGESFDLGE